MAKPPQDDLFRGLRFHTEPSGKLRLEGTVRLAAKYTGLSTRQVHRYIEDGEIEARSPGNNRADAETALDKRGNAVGYKKFLNMRDVFRITYGLDAAEKLLKEMGVE